MVATIEEVCPEAAPGKLRPVAHGPCIREIGASEEEYIMTYFALLPPAGAPVDKLPKKVDLEWPLGKLCNSTYWMLRAFQVSDPATSDYKFYHGDTNEDNYLVDVDNNDIWMIDFGRSYFRWNDKSGSHCITPRKESTPQNGTKDITTFYKVMKTLLILPNSAILPEEKEAYKALRDFVTKKHVNPVTELTKLTDLFEKFAINLDEVETEVAGDEEQ